MKIYAVLGTAPAHFGKPLIEAEVTGVLATFAERESSVMIEELVQIMFSKVEQE
jgi:hypothetical protein